MKLADTPLEKLEVLWVAVGRFVSRLVWPYHRVEDSMGRADAPLSRGQKLPKAFRSLALMRRLNIGAMGLSLAAATAVAFSSTLGSPNSYGAVALATGLPTLLFGILWAFLLRSPKTVGSSKLRWGWLASLPLAAANGGVACGLLLASDSHGTDIVSKFAIGVLAGATVGAFFWFPALLATLAFFGLPVSRSQRLAQQGLAGEARGERVIGLASAILGALALAARAKWGRAADYPSDQLLDAMGNVFVWATPILAIIAGAIATGFARARELRRRHFVSDVESGSVAGFRVEVVPEGKVLLRVTSVGTAYRVANFEEELFALDAQGEAREPPRAMATPRRD